MIPIMPKLSSLTHSLTSDPSPFPSLLLLLLIFTLHIPTCRFFSYFLSASPSLYYHCAGRSNWLCNPMAMSSPKRLPCGGWSLRVAPIALLVVVSWLTEKDAEGVAARNWGSRCCHVPTILDMRKHETEAEGIGGCTPWVLVGMILLLFNMAQRQALIRHCLFVSM
ncbi:hypothetical protein SDJN03_27324, partial [Cucurbita argyrosperma subsp. sororia]